MQREAVQKSIVKRHHNLAPLGLPCVPCIGVNRFIAHHRPVLHRHDGSLEVLFNIGGTCEYIVDKTRHRLKVNDVLVIPPDTDHSVIEYPKGLHTFSLLFRMGCKPLPGLTKGEARWLRQQMLHLPIYFSAVGYDLQTRFLSVLDLAEKFDRTIHDRIALRTAVLDLMLSICKAATRPRIQSVNHHLHNLADRMAKHPESRYPLPQLAREYGLSMNALLAQFRMLTGDTPHAYLLRCRIERAKRMLPSHTGAAIANMLGFSSSQHFVAQFKRLTGVTPGDYAPKSPQIARDQ